MFIHLNPFILCILALMLLLIIVNHIDRKRR
jgi:hypothetical protein